MKYRISAVDKDATLKTVVDEISEKDYKTIMSNIRRLQVSMLSKDYYVIVRDNIKELLAFLPTIEMMNKYSIDTINRYTYNVLGTFYAWIEYYESHYKKIFEPFKKKYYDENFEYRMMYNLRIYITHCEMAITQIEFWPGKSEIYILNRKFYYKILVDYKKILLRICNKCMMIIKKLIYMIWW